MWTSILAILASPAVLGTALQALDYFIAKNNADAATLAALQKLAAFLQSKGVSNAQVAYSAESQIAIADKEWDDVEKVKPVTAGDIVNVKKT